MAKSQAGDARPVHRRGTRGQGRGRKNLSVPLQTGTGQPGPGVPQQQPQQPQPPHQPDHFAFRNNRTLNNGPQFLPPRPPGPLPLPFPPPFAHIPHNHHVNPYNPLATVQGYDSQPFFHQQFAPQQFNRQQFGPQQVHQQRFFPQGPFPQHNTPPRIFPHGPFPQHHTQPQFFPQLPPPQQLPPQSEITASDNMVRDTRPEPYQPCRYFLAGECREGAFCRWSHNFDTQDAGASGLSGRTAAFVPNPARSTSSFSSQSRGNPDATQIAMEPQSIRSGRHGRGSPALSQLSDFAGTSDPQILNAPTYPKGPKLRQQAMMGMAHKQSIVASQRNSRTQSYAGSYAGSVAGSDAALSRAESPAFLSTHGDEYKAEIARVTREAQARDAQRFARSPNPQNNPYLPSRASHLAHEDESNYYPGYQTGMSQQHGGTQSASDYLPSAYSTASHNSGNPYHHNTAPDFAASAYGQSHYPNTEYPSGNNGYQYNQQQNNMGYDNSQNMALYQQQLRQASALKGSISSLQGYGNQSQENRAFAEQANPGQVNEVMGRRLKQQAAAENLEEIQTRGDVELEPQNRIESPRPLFGGRPAPVKVTIRAPDGDSRRAGLVAAFQQSLNIASPAEFPPLAGANPSTRQQTHRRNSSIATVRSIIAAQELNGTNASGSVRRIIESPRAIILEQTEEQGLYGMIPAATRARQTAAQFVSSEVEEMPVAVKLVNSPYPEELVVEKPELKRISFSAQAAAVAEFTPKSKVAKPEHITQTNTTSAQASSSKLTSGTTPNTVATQHNTAQATPTAVATAPTARPVLGCALPPGFVRSGPQVPFDPKTGYPLTPIPGMIQYKKPGEGIVVKYKPGMTREQIQQEATEQQAALRKREADEAHQRITAAIAAGKLKYEEYKRSRDGVVAQPSQKTVTTVTSPPATSSSLPQSRFKFPTTDDSVTSTGASTPAQNTVFPRVETAPKYTTRGSYPVSDKGYLTGGAWFKAGSAALPDEVVPFLQGLGIVPESGFKPLVRGRQPPGLKGLSLLPGSVDPSAAAQTVVQGGGLPLPRVNLGGAQAHLTGASLGSVNQATAGRGFGAGAGVGGVGGVGGIGVGAGAGGERAHRRQEEEPVANGRGRQVVGPAVAPCCDCGFNDKYGQDCSCCQWARGK